MIAGMAFLRLRTALLWWLGTFEEQRHSAVASRSPVQGIVTSSSWRLSGLSNLLHWAPPFHGPRVRYPTQTPRNRNMQSFVSLLMSAPSTHSPLVRRALAATRICGCIGMGHKLRAMTIRRLLARIARFSLQSATSRRWEVSTAFVRVVIPVTLATSRSCTNKADAEVSTHLALMLTFFPLRRKSNFELLTIWLEESSSFHCFFWVAIFLCSIRLIRFLRFICPFL